MSIRAPASRRLGPFVAATAFLFACMTLADAARAQCAAPPEAGTWGNPAPAGVDFSLVRIRFVCGAEQPWFIQVRGTCERAACDWPEVEARKTNTGQIYASYRRGARWYHIYARLYGGNGNQLQLYTWIPATTGSPEEDWTAVYQRVP